MWECLVCAARIDEDDSVQIEDCNMRDHVASHILRSHISADCCGFCGKEPTCTSGIKGGLSSKPKSKGYKAAGLDNPGRVNLLDVDLGDGGSLTSACRYFKKFNRGSLKNPKNPTMVKCTNMPITCSACFSGGHRVFVWKYNNWKK